MIRRCLIAALAFAAAGARVAAVFRKQMVGNANAFRHVAGKRRA